ncbi:MAG TPA: hypothetical protein VN258_06285 [Mobilitalea sp.]|nr:hypothetical protein [Mobilitalea sp.]
MPMFIKNGLVMEVSDVCANLFYKQGWEPYVEIITENATMDTQPDSKIFPDNTVKADTISDTPETTKLSRREVMRMTKDALSSTAKERGYTIISDKRTDMIEEFLKQQGE